MKKWMKKMAIIGAILFVGGIGVTSIGAAIGGAAAGLDFLIDQEKNFQDKYNWGDSEEIWDDTEQLPEEIDEQVRHEELDALWLLLLGLIGRDESVQRAVEHLHHRNIVIDAEDRGYAARFVPDVDGRGF